MIIFISVFNFLEMFKNVYKNLKKVLDNCLKELNVDEKIKCLKDKICIEEIYLIEKVFVGLIKDIVRYLEILF